LSRSALAGWAAKPQDHGRPDTPVWHFFLTQRREERKVKNHISLFSDLASCAPKRSRLPGLLRRAYFAEVASATKAESALARRRLTTGCWPLFHPVNPVLNLFCAPGVLALKFPGCAPPLCGRRSRRVGGPILRSALRKFSNPCPGQMINSPAIHHRWEQTKKINLSAEGATQKHIWRRGPNKSTTLFTVNRILCYSDRWSLLLESRSLSILICSCWRRIKSFHCCSRKLSIFSLRARISNSAFRFTS